MAKQVEKAYGDALFSACQDANNLKDLNDQVILLGNLLKENPDLYKLLNHPDVSADEKKAILDKVCSWAIPQLLSVLKLMVERGRISSVYKLLDYIVACYKEYMHIGVVSVITATELTAEQKKATEQKILATTAYEALEVNYVIDAQIIGGMVIRIGDRVMDTSVKSRMEQMTRSLKKIQIK